MSLVFRRLAPRHTAPIGTAQFDNIVTTVGISSRPSEFTRSSEDDGLNGV